MNEEMKIKNVLYNYYAISRFELEKYQNNKENKFYLLNYYAENLIKGLLNNCFSYVLNLEAISMLSILKDIKDSEDIDEIIKILKDSAIPYDSKLLRKEDSVEYLFKALTMYLAYYRNYDRPDDELILKHRYDIIYDEMLKNESFGSLLIKMSIIIVNNLSNIVLKMRKLYKDNILSDSLIVIKNIYYNLIICLLFKDQKAVDLRIKHLINYFVTLLELFDSSNDDLYLIRHLNLYSDYYFSYNHHLKLPVTDMKYQKFSEMFGFVENNDLAYLKNKYARNVCDVVSLNQLLLKFIDELNHKFNVDIDEEINQINQTINDMNVLLKHMN